MLLFCKNIPFKIVNMQNMFKIYYFVIFNISFKLQVFFIGISVFNLTSLLCLMFSNRQMLSNCKTLSPFTLTLHFKQNKTNPSVEKYNYI